MAVLELDERRTMTRRLMLQTQEGALVRAEIPSETELLIHAERYGTEAIVETAADLGYPLDAVVRIQQRCDVIEFNWHKNNRKYYTKPKQSADVRVKKLLGIKDEEPEVVAA